MDGWSVSTLYFFTSTLHIANSNFADLHVRLNSLLLMELIDQLVLVYIYVNVHLKNLVWFPLSVLVWRAMTSYRVLFT